MRDNGWFYVDKTPFIKLIERETAEHLLFLRPPRFGKSLFLDTVGCYYDKNTTDEQYERWFKDLSIYEHGLREGSHARSWHVLHFDFSIEVYGKDARGISEAFHNNVNKTIKGLRRALSSESQC